MCALKLNLNFRFAIFFWARFGFKKRSVDTLGVVECCCIVWERRHDKKNMCVCVHATKEEKTEINVLFTIFWGGKRSKKLRTTPPLHTCIIYKNTQNIILSFIIGEKKGDFIHASTEITKRTSLKSKTCSRI